MAQTREGYRITASSQKEGTCGRNLEKFKRDSKSYLEIDDNIPHQSKEE